MLTTPANEKKGRRISGPFKFRERGKTWTNKLTLSPNLQSRCDRGHRVAAYLLDLEFLDHFRQTGDIEDEQGLALAREDALLAEVAQHAGHGFAGGADA